MNNIVLIESHGGPVETLTGVLGCLLVIWTVEGSVP